MEKGKNKMKGKRLLWQRVLAVVLAILMVSAGMDFSGLSTVQAAGETEQTSGSCGANGDNLTWTFDDSTSTLTISGNGAMADYNYSEEPWFSDREKIKTIVIGNGVTTIGDYAFYECSNLISISIPSGVTTIGNCAFYKCSSLTSISIPSGVTTIGVGAFSRCSCLKSISIPSGVTTIGVGAFSRCSCLESISIPSSVTTIGEGVFAGCSGLTTINVDGENEKYDSRENCNAILEKESNTLIAGCNNTTIPEDVTTIEKSAFYGCSGLKSISIPSSVTTIEKSAFYECSSLESISIPSGVTTIGVGAFTGCSDLTTINVDGENEKYDSRENCNAIIEKESNTLIAGCSNTTIPESITTIGDSAFEECGNLESISIPESVTTIGKSAFYRCNDLESISIPESVTTIGNSALYFVSPNCIVNNYSDCDVVAYDIYRKLLTVSKYKVINYHMNDGNTEVAWSNKELEDYTNSKRSFKLGVGNTTLADETDIVVPDGKVFAGWYDNENLSSNAVTSISASQSTRVDLYAKWLTTRKIGFAEGKSASDLSVIYTGKAIEHSTVNNNLFKWDGDGALTLTYYLEDGKTLTGASSGAVSEGGAPVNVGSYVVKAAVARTDTYDENEQLYNFTVSKATPVVNVLPEASAITYGQTLDDSVLSNGTAKYSDSNDTAVTGSYAWKAGTTKPAVADSNTTDYDVTFTPSDAANYNGFTVKVKLTVNKAASAPNMPDTTMAPAHSKNTVGDVTLPTDWIWNTEDASKTLSDGVAVTATAIYNGTDKGNYEKESVEITLTRANCDHANTEIRNAKAATCTEEGYTGDTYCKDCGVLISSGTAIPALGHTGGTATCKEQAVCTRCGEHYGELDPSNHTHTEIRNAKAATCISEGYTGDKYCSDCGAKLSSGTTIAALGHDYVGKITKQPTTTEEGVMTYTCSRCGASYTKPIAKLTSDTSEPLIEDSDGKKGWDVITDTIENAKEGDTVTVDMNGTTTVPGNVIDNIKGKDITVVVDLGNGISWKINGKDVTADNVKDINFGVKTGTNAIPVDVVNEVTGEKTSIQISLDYDGEFGFTATLTVNMEKKNAGYYANLFYYNENTGKLEFMNAGMIHEDGTVDLAFVHASDYTIVVSDKVMDGSDKKDETSKSSEIPKTKETSAEKKATTSTEKTKTGDSSPIQLWILVMIGSGIGVLMAAGKKRKNRQDR